MEEVICQNNYHLKLLVFLITEIFESIYSGSPHSTPFPPSPIKKAKGRISGFSWKGEIQLLSAVRDFVSPHPQDFYHSVYTHVTSGCVKKQKLHICCQMKDDWTRKKKAKTNFLDAEKGTLHKWKVYQHFYSLRINLLKVQKCWS